ncbi:unnamed protein product [Coregonus sp. 'balchen']|nr:unnamed protein product [Coregonus sp. 'balchen']
MKMQMLVLLAVAASLSEGRIFSKCELKSLLEEAALKFNLTAKAKVKNLTNKDFVAKINDRHRPEPPHRRGKRHAGDDVHPNHPNHTANNDNHPTHPTHPNHPNHPTPPTHPTLPRRPEQPPKRGKRHAGNHFTSGEDSSEEETMGTLYGLFQLSDRVICSSGSTPSLNLCQMNCSALIDDNISDDLTCVETIKRTMEIGPGQQTKALKRMIKLLFQKECDMTVASSYFSKC